MTVTFFSAISLLLSVKDRNIVLCEEYFGFSEEGRPAFAEAASRRQAKVAPTHDVNDPKSLGCFDYWRLGFIWILGFGYWNFLFYRPPTK
jgi:hypothetical protein